MLLIQIKMTCETDADFERLKTLCAGIVPQVRAEPSCLSVDFAVDLNAPRTLRAVSRWPDEAALTAHIQAPHTQRYMAAVAEVTSVAMDSTQFEIAAQAPFASGPAAAAFDKLSAEHV